MLHLLTRKTLGWREWIALPDLGVDFIKAKIDTGAKTSVLHAENIRIVRRGVKRYVRFTVFADQKSKKAPSQVRAKFIERRMVRSSSGHVSKRPVIRTRVKLGRKSWMTEITLVNRDLMGFRMLLGRNALQRKFLVDPSHSFLVGKVPSKKERPVEEAETEDYF